MIQAGSSCHDWADLKGFNASPTAGIAPFDDQTEIDAIGLFTGQVGYAWNNVLGYVKGGAAVTNNHYTSFFTAPNIFAPVGTVFNQADETRWGDAVWERESNSGLHRTGRSPSNTIICSWGPTA